MQFNPPTRLNIKDRNVADGWRRFKQNFDLYLEANEKIRKPDKLKIAILLNLMGEECVEIFNNFKMEDADRNNLDLVLAQFDNYFEPRKNTLMARYKFFNCKQKPSENIDEFVTNLKTLARDCEFSDLEESLIRDFVIIGIRDKACKENLLIEPTLTLEQAIKYCRAKEISEQQIKLMQEGGSVEISGDIEVIKQIKRGGRQTGETEKTRRGSDNRRKQLCRKCNSAHGYGKCPAYGKRCYKCERTNHFAVACKAQKQLNEIDNVESEDDESFSLDTVTDQVNTLNSLWTETLQINGKKISFKLDSGSDANMIPKSVVELIARGKEIKIEDTKRKLKSYTGHTVKTLGSVTLQCELGYGVEVKTFSINFCVVEDPHAAILGANACQEMGLVQRIRVNNIENQGREKILSEYKDIFTTGVGLLPYTYDIKLKSDAEPRITPARVIPAALKTRVKEEIERMVRAGILMKVEEPTEWVHPIVTIEKPNKQLRLCMDPRHLNKFVKRQHYCMPTQRGIFSQMKGAKYFSVLDASSAFLQIPLTKESSKLCTVATPFGRYRFCRLPYGLSSAPEVYQGVMDGIFAGLEGVLIYVDDILIFGETLQEHNGRLKAVLHRARQNKLTLSRDKCKIAVQSVEYLGYTLSKEGIAISDQKIKAISDYKKPENKQELQRYLGMITYLAKYIPDLSEKTAALRNLLSTKNEFVWTANETKSFEELKTLVTEAPVLGYFDPAKKTTLTVDASSYGLGAVITQEGHPIAYGSTTLTECQQRYSQIEKELLAIVSGVKQFHYYLYGTEFEVQTDHRPLIGLLKKPMDTISPRLQRMTMTLLRYRFQLTHVPGKQLYAADALSRAPINTEINTKEMENMQVYTIISAGPEKIRELEEETIKDSELRAVKLLIEKGWPKHKKLVPVETKPYWDIRPQLYTDSNLIFYGTRLVIPRSQRRATLDKLHEAHQGINSCQRKAKISVYWPGMMNDITNTVSNCGICQRHQKANTKQPLMPYPIPERPWQEVGLDFVQVERKDFLVLVDYHSKFVEIRALTNKSAKPIIKILKQIFRTHGIPMTVHSDNGPPFDSYEFRDFVKTYDINLSTSSPRYPRSNGMIERAIQTIENLLKKAMASGSDPNIAIMEYNNTPKHNLPAPATMLMGRRLRTRTMVHEETLKPEFDTAETLTKLRDNQLKQKEYADRGARDLRPLKLGEKVMVQRGTRDWIPAEVTKIYAAPRSYLVKTGRGEIRRNRIHLRPTTNQQREPVDGQIINPKGVGGSESKPQNLRPRSQRQTRESERLKDYVRY